jgi:hypothetical protein
MVPFGMPTHGDGRERGGRDKHDGGGHDEGGIDVGGRDDDRGGGGSP